MRKIKGQLLVLSGHLKLDKTMVLMTNGSLMQIESIAEWSILQNFWPALSDNWSWNPIFGLSESDRFRQVLLVHEESSNETSRS